MKYRDFKTMSNDEMKAVKGGNPPANQTYCGTCTNMISGTPLERSNVVCASLPAGTICQDQEGVYNHAMHCGTPSGTLYNFECPYIGS